MDEILQRAERERDAARLRVRDLENFIRLYKELVGAAPVASPQPPSEEAEPALVRRPGMLAADVDIRRPAISLADPELSISDASAKVLRHFLRPMRAREMAETMLAWGYAYTGGVQVLRSSIGAVLAREVREGGHFVKVGRGVFGMRDWSDTILGIMADDDDAGGDDLEVEEDDRHLSFPLGAGVRNAGDVDMR